ncbi:MAG: hypothetical protein Q9219_001692 [cf. Caloplaca sp. 3 TL-2023]
MLRLASTRITLNSSDLEWHVRRHETRQAALQKVKFPSGAVDRSKAQSQSPGPSTRRLIDGGSRLQRSRGTDVEIPIYSDEPIPRDSQAFWDQILADAGTSTRVQQAASARSPHIVELSDAFLDNSGSVPLSIRGENDDNESRVPSDSTAKELLISPRSPVSESDSSLTAELRSRPSLLSLSSLDGVEDQRRLQSRHSSLDSDIYHSSIKETVDTHLPSDSQKQDAPSEEDADEKGAWLNQRDVDGPSDAAPNLHHYSSTSSLQDPEPESIGMPFGAQARKAELAASRKMGVSRSGARLDVFYGEPDVQDGYIQQHVRTRSGGLPRSRLYISEAVASSSPEKQQRSSAQRRNTTPDTQRSDSLGIDADASRIASASSNPFGHPSDGSLHNQYIHTRNPFALHNNDAVRSPSGSVFHAANGSNSSSGSVRRHYPASSSYHSPFASQSEHLSSPYSPELPINNRLFSPLILPHISDSTPFETSPFSRQPLERLPTPVSVGSRTASATFNQRYNIPSTDENSYYPPTSSSPYLPSTPPPRSISTTSMHHTPTRLSVYNDSLPAYSQPQTPIGLPRNGLPAMSLRNPFFTAPVRVGARIRRGAANWLSNAFVTPTRGAGRREGQENVGVEVEVERRGTGEEGRRGGWRMSDWER